MGYYPDNHFIQEFAQRTRNNVDAMYAGEKLEWRDTALISFLLGVFVLPHERSDEDKYMVKLLKSYPVPLENVVTILRQRRRTAADGKDDPPTSLEQLPAYLRNAVSHFNIRPESVDEQNLTHLLIWNRLPQNRGKDAGKITFVARVNVEGLRCLAIHILEQLAHSDMADRYEATDPIAEYDKNWPVTEGD